jgi:hypothetical protein
MNKEDLLKLAGDERFIPGIYNYCDRWCERCPFTSRCMNFALTDEESQDPESRDMRNRAFWFRLSETFRVTLELIKDMAEREGIDLDATVSEDEVEDERLNDEIAGSQKCCHMAKTYSDMVDAWFDSVSQPSEEKEDDPESEIEVPVPDGDPFETRSMGKDALEVVRWYRHQVYVKLMRAVRGALEEEEGSREEFARDSDGSAKVALIGIERSIAAWGELRPFCLPDESKLLKIIVHLESLRKEVERVFPGAREFIRPGFDHVELNS